MRFVNDGQPITIPYFLTICRTFQEKGCVPCVLLASKEVSVTSYSGRVQEGEQERVPGTEGSLSVTQARRELLWLLLCFVGNESVNGQGSHEGTNARTLGEGDTVSVDHLP